MLYLLKMKLISQIVSATLGLQLATMFVSGVVIKIYPTSNFFGFPLTAQWHLLIILGVVLGLLNYFLEPLLETLSLPLKMVSLGLFTIVIDMGLIWLLDIMFDELYISSILSILYIALIILAINIIIGLFTNKR
jgi:uncharacterized membrane protein YvlD (DUF360 family)